MTLRYVGKGGNDGWDGLTWGTRKLTLNGVEDTPVVAGDTVYVGPGLYRETLTVDVTGTNGNPITYVADITGVHTDGIGGVVYISAGLFDEDTSWYQNNIDASAASDYRTFRGFTMILCSTACVELGGSNHDGWIIEDCHLLSEERSIMWSGGTTKIENFIIRRCILQPIIVQIGYLNAFDSNWLIENCIFASICGRNGYPPWDYDIFNYHVWNFRIVNCTFATLSLDGCIYSTLQDLPQPSVATKVYNSIFRTPRFQSNRTDGIETDYSNICPSLVSPVFQNTSVGANTSYYPAFFMPPIIADGIRFPWSDYVLAPWSPIIGLPCNSDAPSDDFFGITRPTSDAKKTRGAIQYAELERETTTVYKTNTESMKMRDAMGHQIIVPITGKRMTFSAKVHRQADYTGTNPQLIIKQYEQSDQVVTDTGSSGQWNDLSLSLTPASSPGWVALEIRSDNTAVAGDYATFWSDLRAK